MKKRKPENHLRLMQEHELKIYVSAAHDDFSCCTITPEDNGYKLSFGPTDRITEAVLSSKRAPVRIFKSIDAAYSTAKRIGYSYAIIKEDVDE